MKKFHSIILAAVAIAAVCGLAGCGGTPGDTEVREAVKGRLVSMWAMMNDNKPMGPKPLQEMEEALAKLKVIGCKAADPKNGFNCDWTAPEILSTWAGNSGRVVKGDSGWLLMKTGE